MRAWRPLRKTSDQQDDCLAIGVSSLPHRAGENIEHFSTDTTPIIYDRSSIHHVGRLILLKCVAKGAFDPLWMKDSKEVLIALHLIEQICDWKEHHGWIPPLAGARSLDSDTAESSQTPQNNEIIGSISFLRPTAGEVIANLGGAERCSATADTADTLSPESAIHRTLARFLALW